MRESTCCPISHPSRLHHEPSTLKLHSHQFQLAYPGALHRIGGARRGLTDYADSPGCTRRAGQHPAGPNPVAKPASRQAGNAFRTAHRTSHEAKLCNTVRTIAVIKRKQHQCRSRTEHGTHGKLQPDPAHAQYFTGQLASRHSDRRILRSGASGDASASAFAAGRRTAASLCFSG